MAQFANRLRMEIDPNSRTVFDRAFNRFQRDIEDWTEIFQAIGELNLEWTQEQFWHAGSPGGTPWPDLTEAYEEQKAETHPFMPILQRERDLYFSATRRGWENNVFSVDKKSAAFGTIDPKARWHQQGTPKMQARPILAFNDIRRTQLTKLVQANLLQLIRKTGLGTYATER